MRTRRGNYMILFAMLLPLMLGFMALAIDIGRLRVARVQMQGAADAAALAALVQLREGGGYGAAVQAANSVANEVRIQRVSGGGSTEFNVAVATGAWNFANASWEDSNLSFSGVTVNLTQRQPLGLLFAPIFEMGSGSGFAGKVYAGGSAGSDVGSRKVLRLGRRAAMRPRDLILVVDISALHGENLSDYRASINDMVEQMRLFGVVEDRVGIVGFAGDAVELLPLTSIDEDLSAIRFGVDAIQPCEVDLEAWFHWYRFLDSSLDPEILGEPAFDYNPIWFASVFEDGLPRMRWDVDSYEAELMLETTGEGSGITEATWTLPLTEEGQCAAWGMSEILFQYADPRRLVPGSFTPLEFAPLACHAGNYFEGEADRFEWAMPYPEVDCSITGWDEVFPGHPALIDGGDPDPVYDYPDRSYAQAGTNPGAGLLMAAGMLEAAWPSRNEPMVVLLTAGGPECGPSIDLSAATDCDAQYEAQLAQSVALIDARDAHTHVLGLVEAGSTADVLLSGAVTGRGVYQQTEDPNDFDEFLREVGRDIRLQVVE